MRSWAWRWSWVFLAVVALFGGWVNRRLPWYGVVIYAALFAFQALALMELAFARKGAPILRAPSPPPPRPARVPVTRSRCYLVVHLDLRVSPPVALFVHTYSCSAKDLTHTGAPEARADLYMIECDTFQEALDEMQRIQPLYFPWVTPLLTRNR